MILVCKSVGIWDGFVNPIYGCGVKIAPDKFLSYGFQNVVVFRKRLWDWDNQMFNYDGSKNNISSWFNIRTLSTCLTNNNYLFIVCSNTCLWKLLGLEVTVGSTKFNFFYCTFSFRNIISTQANMSLRKTNFWK